MEAELYRIAHSERAEDGGVGADSQRQRQDRGDREPGSPLEGASSIAEISDPGIHGGVRYERVVPIIESPQGPHETVRGRPLVGSVIPETNRTPARRP